MQLPFTIAVEAPGRSALRRAARSPWAWLLLAGLIAAIGAVQTFTRGQASRGYDSGEVTLEVSSLPPDAAIDIDGRVHGRTPRSLPLSPGAHRVTLRQDGYADAAYHIGLAAGHVTVLRGELWLWTPQVRQLRPTFPGATIASASFLADGRIALSITLPPDDERQTWLVDGERGTRRLGPPEARAALAVSADGGRIAYLARRQGPGLGGDGRLDEVWIAKSDGELGTRRYALPPGVADERLLDLSWAPAGDHLLVVRRQQLAGGGFRTRLLWLDAAGGATRELVSLPSEVVPGSYSWSPSGERVAFLAQAGPQTALCLVAIDGREFRYLHDLGQADPSPLPFPPLGWSPDGSRLLYAAPTQDRPNQGGWLWGPRSVTGLFEAAVDRPHVQRLGAAEGQSPAWRADGTIVALARPKLTGPLTLREVGANGEVRALGELPFKAASTYAARWDVAHAQAIVAVRGSSNSGATRPDYWLVRYREDDR
jgi:hypothetical protein